MSVINQMLKDLDKRHQLPPLANVTPHQVQYAGREQASNKWLPVSLISLLAGGLSVYAFLSLYAPKPSTEALPMPNQVVKVAPEHADETKKVETHDGKATNDVAQASQSAAVQKTVVTETLASATSPQLAAPERKSSDTLASVAMSSLPETPKTAALPPEPSAIRVAEKGAMTANAATLTQTATETQSPQPQTSLPIDTVTRGTVVNQAADSDLIKSDVAHNDVANNDLVASQAVKDVAVSDASLSRLATQVAVVNNLEVANGDKTTARQIHTAPQEPPSKTTNSDIKVDVPINVPVNGEVAASSVPLTSAASQAKTAGDMAVTEVKLSPSQLAQKQLALATDAEKQGNLTKAVGHYEKALSLEPSLHAARKQLAALYYGQGQFTKAGDSLSQGRLLYPQEFEFALLLARVQHDLGDTDLALATLGQIPDSHSLARQKWLAEGDLAQKQGQFSLAEQAYRKLLQQEPQQPKWWMGLAYALDSQLQFSQARQAYRTALTYSGLSTQATTFIEQRLRQLGESQ